MPTKKMDEKLRRRIERGLLQGKTQREISEETGASTGAISNVARSVDKREIARSRESRAKDVKVYDDAMKEVEKLRKELAAYTEIEQYVKCFNPISIKPRRGGKGEAAAVLCWNDWHFEEVVDSAAVNGVNEYNPTIAKARFESLLRATLSIIEMCRSKSHIDTIIVNLLGDLITGYIHEELMATNAMTPGAAILEVFEMVASGLEFLQKETKAQEIVVPCVCGNHGRWTKKRWSKEGPGMSFEGLMYSFLAKWFLAKQNRTIKLLLPKGDMTYLTVYDRRIRVTHGDNIRYAGGIGGVHVPLRKALDAWNTQVPADYTYLGHWHNEITGEDYRISGSMIGFNEYSIRIKARYQPPSQAFELIHPKYGATARFPIVLGTRGV